MANDKRKLSFKWYTNGTKNIKIYENDVVPDEYTQGRCRVKKDTANVVCDENVNIEAFSGLSEDERKVALKILEDINNNGNFETYNLLKYADYEEIPVDIHTFLHDKRYLGGALTDEEGRFTLFPYWEELFDKIYNDNIATPNYNILALTGAIGLGKSTEAVILGIYELYKMLCLKDPYSHYGLMPTDLITFAVINITKELARGVAWNKLQSMIKASPWFMERGSITKGDIGDWKPPKGIELIYGSRVSHILGKAVFWSFLDEVSFQPNKDVEEQKKKAKELVNAALRRMQSRFQRGEFRPTILCLASSKRTESSYMEVFIEEKRRQDSKTVLVVDEPQWIVRPDKQSDRWFKVAVGNKFISSEVLPLNVSEEELSIYRNRGQQILDVPFGYYEEFISDVDDALNEIAGVSTMSSSRFINGPRLAKIKTNSYKNLFVKEIIEVGDGIDDETQYYNFVDLDRLDAKFLSKPLFIHMDLSESGDKTGIAGIWVVGKKPSNSDNTSKDLVYRLAFSVSIKAPKGHDISFEKNRNFIYWLRDRGFNIRMITTDTFQSFDTGQMLKKAGFEYEVLSVDRTTKLNNSGEEGAPRFVCLPYQTLRTAISEERLEMYENTFLTEELLGLEKDNISGKVDHTPLGINSKDSADALCGALYEASLHADEFAYEYGENLGHMLVANTDEDELDINKAFEQELSTMLDPLSRSSELALERAKRSAEITQQNINRQQYKPSRIDTSVLSEGIMTW